MVLGQTFHACLHWNGQSIILLKRFSPSEELPSMRRVSWKGRDAAILEYNVTAKVHFHHRLSSVRLFCVTWKKIITGFLSCWFLAIDALKELTSPHFAFLLDHFSLPLWCPVWYHSCLPEKCLVLALAVQLVLVSEIAFCSSELFLIVSFLVNIFNYGIICSLGDKEGLKNCCDPSLWILSVGTEAVAFLIMPQTPLILKGTWNFEQNNS